MRLAPGKPHPLAAVLLPAALLLALASPSLPAADAAAHRASARTVSGALDALERSGAITPAAHRQFMSGYIAAKRSLTRLSGTRAAELGAVLANLQSVAAAGLMSPSRLPVLFLTLERNRQWWTTEPLLSNGVRVSFPGSRLVWEYYAGQGIEIQWLGTFGKANGYYLAGNENSNLRQLLGEVMPLASQRAGGIAWEYLFHFDGGAPPWTSGLSQGTALQVLARAWSRFKEPSLLAAAQQALGVFNQGPPAGVRVRRPAGIHYAEYSYAPSDRILNGFIQALVGLYDYTAITHDPHGLELFEAGDAQARAEVPRYDTGAWSRYDQFGESSLNYHELLTEFLQHLCQRTRKGAPLAGAPAPATTPAPSTTTTTPTPPIAGDEVYCTTAQRFQEDLRTPPSVSLLTRTLPGGARGGVQISLSKISTVTLTVHQGSRIVWRNSATVEAGKPRILWVTPAGGGSFAVTISATDLAGNFSTSTGTITVAHR